MKYFGEQYAKDIIRNAKALAEELHARGFKVLGKKYGFTEHIRWLWMLEI